MPCNTVQRNNIEIKALDVDMLAKTLDSLLDKCDIPVSFLNQFYGKRDIKGVAEAIIKAGSVSVRPGDEYIADLIKQEYSRQVVASAAKRFGWRIQEKTKQKLVVTRRG